MAIGDTVQAGLGRMDFSAFQTAGAAQARANEAFGNALGQAATAYFEGKEKKEQKNALKEYLMRNGANEEDANAMTKSPQALEMFNQKLARDQQMDIAKLRVAAQRAEGGANRAQVAAKMEDEQNLRNELKQGKREMDNIFLMANAPSYTDDYGQFNQDTGNRAIDQSSPEAFLKTIREANVMPQTDVGRGMLADELRRMRDASIPKPLSPSDQLAREKFDYEKAKDAEEAKPKPPQAPIYMEAAIEAIDDSLKFVEEDSIINPTVGFGSETMANIGGTDAANLQAALSTVTSAIGFKRLQDMREASPTGGALGAVSERELSQLNAALGSISQKQGKPQLKKNLERIKKHYQNSVKAINAQRMAYQQGKTFKSEQEALDFINQQSQGPGIDTKQGTYRIPGLSVEAQ